MGSSSPQMLPVHGSWRGVEERQSLEAIVKDITDEYQIDQTTARVHVESFLIELERQKLIQREMPS